METTKPLNDKQKRFCEEYVANGYNASKAYQITHPNVSPAVAANSGYRLLKDQRYIEYIGELEKDIYEANRINMEHISNELASIAFGTVTNDSRLSYTDKSKALELLGKQLSLFNQKIDLNTPNGFTINIINSEDE